MLKLGFWSKDSGAIMSHPTGLTQEQIIALRELKAGDRLILWHNKVEYPNDPSYTLKVYIPAKKPPQE